MSCVSWCDYPGEFPTKEPPTKLVKWEVDLATFSNWLRNRILQHFFVKGVEFTPPAQLYASLHSTASTAALAGTELSGDGYARVAVDFERVSDIKLWNVEQYNHPLATAQWTVASLGLWDSPNTGQGNYYAFGNLTESLTVASGKTIVYPANGTYRGILIGMGSPL